MLFISMTLHTAMNASEAGRHVCAPMNSANLYGGGMAVCVCARACVCAHTWHACVHDVFAIYDKKI